MRDYFVTRPLRSSLASPVDPAMKGRGCPEGKRDD